MSNPAALLIVLLASPVLASAYPYLWATRVLPLEVLKGAPLTATNCIGHPATKEGGHGAPAADRMITITAVTAGAATATPVKELCPGVKYLVNVQYPEKRRTLLTTTAGRFDNGNATCPALVYTLKPEKAAEDFKATLSVPCNTTEASTTLKVTSAASSSAAFKTASLKLPIAALSKCPQSTCAGGEAANTSLAATNETLASNETLAGGNDTLAAGNETLAGGNETLSANDTMSAGNQTSAEDADAAGNATDAAAPNATLPAAAGGASKAGETSKPADASKAEAPKTAEPAKTKSAAATSSPVSFLAAAAAGVVVLGVILL